MTPLEAMKIRHNPEPISCDIQELHDCIDEALIKQIPYKPKEYEDKYYACKCGNILLMKWREYLKELTPKSESLPYCLACGQALDWSENNE